MRTLVTGASGFIGGVLSRRLLERGHEVVALVRRPGSEPPGTRARRGRSRRRAALAGASGRRSRSASCTSPPRSLRSAARRRSTRSTSAGTERLLSAWRSPARRRPARRVLLDRRHRRCRRRAAHRGDAAARADAIRSRQAGGRAPRARLGPAGRGRPPLARLRPRRLVRRGADPAAAPARALRRDRRRARTCGTSSTSTTSRPRSMLADGAALRRAPPTTWSTTSRSPSTTSWRSPREELGVGPPRRIPAALARLVAGRNAVDAVVRSARSSNARIKRGARLAPRFATAREGVADAAAARGACGRGSRPRSRS